MVFIKVNVNGLKLVVLKEACIILNIMILNQDNLERLFNSDAIHTWENAKTKFTPEEIDRVIRKCKKKARKIQFSPDC